MAELSELVEQLSVLAKTKTSEATIREVLRTCLAKVNIMAHTLGPTYTLARIRRNQPGERFRLVSELSYRPKRISGAQRANTRRSTMFYGASCERWDRGDVFTDKDYGLKIALFETLPELRESYGHSGGRLDFDKYPRRGFPSFDVRVPMEPVEVTYGIWVVLERLILARACPFSLYDENLAQRELDFRLYFNVRSPDFVNRLNDDLFWNYLALQFSSSNYTISGVVAELLTIKGFDGVSYPSKRSDGLGINIAITPKATERQLRCVAVGRALVSVRERELVIDQLATADLHEGDQVFSLYG